MSEPINITFEPETSAGEGDGGFVQCIRIAQDDQPVGMARWRLHAEDEGAVQIIDLEIRPPHRRRGHAGRLMAEIIAQSRARLRQRNQRLRRIWLVVRQKDQIVARAFLLKHGFHHVATIPDLFAEQDALVYTRAI